MKIKRRRRGFLKKTIKEMEIQIFGKEAVRAKTHFKQSKRRSQSEIKGGRNPTGSKENEQQEAGWDQGLIGRKEAAPLSAGTERLSRAQRSANREEIFDTSQSARTEPRPSFASRPRGCAGKMTSAKTIWKEIRRTSSIWSNL